MVPIYKIKRCKSGKYKIDTGKCIYTKEEAIKKYRRDNDIVFEKIEENQ